MTLVVKLGGSAGVATDTIVQEIAELLAEGQRVIVVHGGSDFTNALCRRLEHPIRMITSPSGMVSRYTDRATLDVFAMAVVGQINTQLVALLQGRGVNALGLAGVDGRLLLARRKRAVRSVTSDGRVQVIRDDYTGQIEEVNCALLHLILGAGYTPVVAPLALSYEGERLNVDGDRAAGAIAAACRASTLAIMTNVPGLLRNPEQPETLVHIIPAAQISDYMESAYGGMRKKLLGAQEALRGGVPRVYIGSNSLRAVLDGAGTIVEADGATALSIAANEREDAASSPSSSKLPVVHHQIETEGARDEERA